MRQVMPHRNNIGARSRSCKRFLPPLRRARSTALLAGLRLGRDAGLESEIKIVKSKPYAVNNESRRGGGAESGDG